jgi:hypothetical protein
LRYDAETGHLISLVRRGSLNAGDRAGKLKLSGYRVITIEGVQYLEHRICWYLHTEAWPDEIDHRDTVPSNNAASNLRPASHTMNAQNVRAATARSKSGVLGVYEKGGQFVSFITVDKKSVYLGTFLTLGEASQRYVDAKRELHPGCTL